MNVEQLKRIINEQREEIDYRFGKWKLVERELPKERVLEYLKAPNILAVLGVRRCGKTTFSLMLERERCGYVNFDDERMIGIEAEELNDVLQALYELHGPEMEYIILDEIQNVAGWELFANRLRRTKKVIVTGSNSKLLAGELATHLTGRYMDFTLFPFSFREFLKLKEQEVDVYSTASIAEAKNALRQYLKTGGFPEAHLLGPGMVSRIYGDIIQKDILRRHRIRRERQFFDFARYLVSNFSKEITFRKTANVTSLGNIHTIRKYVGYLESSYLVFLINRFSFKLKEQMKAPKKVYCIDTGIVNSMAFRFSEDMGRIMENVVAVELMRRNAYVGGGSLFYWKDHQQREVDFVVKSNGSVGRLIQVSDASSRVDIEDREIKSLVLASDQLRCRNLMMITWDFEGEVDSVECVPLWKWLLKPRGP
ncbi:MAG: ATP-binding protein [Methanomassiliicoccales archaeon]|nr:ATP-binding protein [Methanomassiliicoccales archaeon]